METEAMWDVMVVLSFLNLLEGGILSLHNGARKPSCLQDHLK